MKRRPVKWILAIPVEVMCEYTGIPQGDYYTDLAATVAAHDRFPGLFEEATGYRPPTSHPTPVTAYEGVAALGGTLAFPRDHQPQVVNLGHVLARPEDVDRLGIPVFGGTPRYRKLLAWHAELKRRFPDTASNLSAGQEGPVTTAVLLRGEQFFLDCVDDPPRAHRLLEVVTGMFVDWTRAARAVDGVETDTVLIADDHAGLLGPDLWPAFVLPYYRRITDALGPRCWMHTELVRRTHLPLFRDMDLVAINYSEDQYLAPRDTLEVLPGVPCGWHILTVAEMQQGTPEGIRRRYAELAAMGFPEIRCEMTVDTPAANVRAFLAAAREHEGG
jgi:hypothetical protein